MGACSSSPPATLQAASVRAAVPRQGRHGPGAVYVLETPPPSKDPRSGVQACDAQVRPKPRDEGGAAPPRTPLAPTVAPHAVASASEARPRADPKAPLTHSTAHVPLANFTSSARTGIGTAAVKAAYCSDAVPQRRGPSRVEQARSAGEREFDADAFFAAQTQKLRAAAEARKVALENEAAKSAVAAAAALQEEARAADAAAAEATASRKAQEEARAAAAAAGAAAEATAARKVQEEARTAAAAAEATAMRKSREEARAAVAAAAAATEATAGRTSQEEARAAAAAAGTAAAAEATAVRKSRKEARAAAAAAAAEATTGRKAQEEARAAAAAAVAAAAAEATATRKSREEARAAVAAAAAATEATAGRTSQEEARAAAVLLQRTSVGTAAATSSQPPEQPAPSCAAKASAIPFDLPFFPVDPDLGPRANSGSSAPHGVRDGKSVSEGEQVPRPTCLSSTGLTYFYVNGAPALLPQRQLM